MFKHDREVNNPVNECRIKLMNAVTRRYQNDGINSVTYDVLQRVLKPLYTWVLADIKVNESLADLNKEGICSK